MRVSHSVPKPMQAHQDLVLTWGPSPAVSVRDQLSLIAHELRAPLAALTISAELLADDAGSLDQHRIRAMAGLILRRALWLQALVENLLYAGRLSEGPFRIAPRPTDLSCLLLDVESVVEPLLVQQDQLLKLCEATPLPPVMADARGIG